jgi:PAS domain S-box-containing protein
MRPGRWRVSVSKPGGDSDLHARAESWLRTARGEDEALATEVMQSFVYDLQVYQVELAMQNEELRRVERELERSKDRYRALYELAPVAYLTLDEAGRIAELNQQASTLLGVERSQLAGSGFADRIAPTERARFYDQHQRVLSLRTPCSYELTLTTRPLQRAVRGEAQYGQMADGQPCVLLVLCDITEQRLADNALRAEMTQRALTERILRRERDFAEGLLATTPGLFVELNRRGRILRCNRNFEQLSGYRIEEVLGTDAFALLLPPALQETMRDRFNQALQGARTSVEASAITPMLTRSGQERAVTWSVAVLKDDLEQPTGMLLLGIDLTEQKRLEADLRQSQKLEAIGQLASGIAHDFNNLLLGQAGLAEIVASKLAPDNPAQTYLGQIKQAMAVGAGLTRQLLDFARKRPVERVSVDLSRLVERSGALLRCLLPKNIELQFALGESVWVTGDPGQLEQVLLNLFVNARDALPSGGTLRVATTSGCPYAGDSDAPAAPARDRHVMLKVSDNGVGMDEETQRRAYEPFFTTKKPGAGTGLGLSTVYGIVTQSGGHIHLRSAPGQGTTFEICLLRAEPPVHAAPPLLQPATPASGETILCIEDEATVRALVRHRLQGQGYRVLEAENGDQALQLCRSSEPIALAITDIILPGAPGDEVAQRMTELRPGLPILFMSALPPDRLVREGRLPAGAVSLQKPFSEHDLRTKVQELLRTGPPRPATARRSQVVLVVEDDETNRIVLQELLELSDYTVLSANGAEAAQALLGPQQRCDLVITDYGLPGKNGLALSTELLTSRPTLRALLITGRGLDDPLLAGAAEQTRLRLMRKPFDFEGFLGTVAELLGGVC